MKREWYNNINKNPQGFLSSGLDSTASFFIYQEFSENLKNNKQSFIKSISGYLDSQFVISDITNILIEEFKYNKILEYIPDKIVTWYDNVTIFVNENSLITLDFNNKTRHIYFNHISSDNSKFSKVESSISKFITTDQKSDKECFVLVKDMEGGLRLDSIGSISSPLERGNYTEEVISDYDYVAQQLNSKTPQGRLVILNGMPGTGKTHLISGWVNEVKDCKFIFITPEMVTELTGPNLVSLFVEEGEDKPNIIVLEDADDCLAKREGDNRSKIQSILNLADGILGKMMNIRIIATTNVSKLDMDDAILRKGRLCKHIEVDLLPSEYSSKVYKRLTGNDELLNKLSLADIYALANNIEINTKEKPKVGF